MITGVLVNNLPLKQFIKQEEQARIGGEANQELKETVIERIKMRLRPVTVKLQPKKERNGNIIIWRKTTMARKPKQLEMLLKHFPVSGSIHYRELADKAKCPRNSTQTALGRLAKVLPDSILKEGSNYTLLEKPEITLFKWTALEGKRNLVTQKKDAPKMIAKPTTAPPTVSSAIPTEITVNINVNFSPLRIVLGS